MAVKTFTTGEVLTAADTNTYLNNGGLVYITQASWTTGGTVSVNNCFTSTYSSYRLVVRNAKHATTAVSVLLRLRVGGVDKGTNSYYYGNRFVPMGGTGGGDDGGSNVGQIVTGIVASTTLAGIGSIDIHDPQKAAITSCTYQALWPGTTALSGAYMGAGFLDNTTAYDGFSLIANSGNFTSLTVYVYGYRES
jgi:hypothetical protein